MLASNRVTIDYLLHLIESGPLLLLDKRILLAAHWTFDGPADRHVVYQYNDDRGAAYGSSDVDTVQTRKATYLGLTVGAGGRIAETRSFYNVQGRLWLTWVDETGIGLPTHIDGYEYDDAGVRVKSGPIVLVGDMDLSLVIDGFDVDDFEFALANKTQYETDYGTLSKVRMTPNGWVFN